MRDRSTPAPTDSQRQIATVVADEIGELARRREERPERGLEPPGAVPFAARASRECLEVRGDWPAEVPRGRNSGEGSLGEGRVRSAHAPTVAGNEYAGEGRLRLVAADDRKAPRVGVPAMLAAEEPRELD